MRNVVQGQWFPNKFSIAGSKGNFMNLGRIILLMALLLTPADAFAATGKAETLAALARQDLRLASTGYRLSVANSQRCSALMPATGLLLHSIAQYQGDWREAALDQFGAIGPISIEGVVTQSPASAAGLQRGDEILAVNGTVLDTIPSDPRVPTALRDRTEDWLVSLPPANRISLRVRANGAVRDVDLNPAPACLARFEVVAGTARLARSDGHLIQVGQALAAEASDADLAVIVAHELAHSILGHRAKLAEIERDKDRSARRRYETLARQFESDADRLSVHLLASAGYDPKSAPAFMRRFGKQFDVQVRRGSLHAKAEARARDMDDEIARMAAGVSGA